MQAQHLHSHPLTRTERWFLVTLIAAGAILRVTYILEIRTNPFFEHPRLDGLFHDRWAESIASGNLVGETVFFRAPGYPYFLAGIYAMFGHSYLAARLVQMGLGLASLFLLYFVARRIGGKYVAMVAATIALLNPMLLYFEGELLFESVLAFLSVLFFMIAGWTSTRPTMIRWMLTGLVFGTICIVRPTYVALAPVIFILVTWYSDLAATQKVKLRKLLLLTLGCLLPILPIGIRNYVVGNDIVLIASQGGVNFFIGNNPDADGYSSSMPTRRGAGWENRDQTYQVEKAIGHVPLPSEESWYWYKAGMQFIVEQPGQYLKLLAKKTYLFFNAYEIPNNQNFYSFSQYSVLLQWLPAGFWLIGPIAMLGMILAAKNREARLLLWFAGLYIGVTIAFFVCDRFRLPLIPFFALFAAIAIVEFIGYARATQWKSLSAMIIGGAILALLVNSDVYSIQQSSTARDAMSRGIVELEQGNPGAAAASFEEAEQRSPSPPPNLYLNRGVAEWRLGKKSEAMMFFQRELQHYGDSYDALCNIASIYLAGKNLDSASRYATIALTLKPYLPGAYTLCAQTLLLRRDTAQAIALLENGKNQCGQSFVEGNVLLAEAYRHVGRYAEAESLYLSVAVPSQQKRHPLYAPELNFLEGGVSSDDLRHARTSAMKGLALLADRQGRLEETVIWLRMSAALSPRNADVLSDLGLALMHTRRFAAADSAFTQALSLDASRPLLWYNYATLLGTMGRLDEAERAFERVLALQPSFHDAEEKLLLTRRIRAGHVPQRK